MQGTGFSRRIFSFPTFSAALDDVTGHLDDLKAAARSQRVSRAFAERIMLAVTQVNGCRYCDYGHTLAALRTGVTQDELRALREGNLDALPEGEVVALLFAQHYAERNGHPDPAAWERVVETYEPDAARDIMAYIRMIMMGNLLGNTFDAFWSRLAGRPAPGSSILDEIGVLAGMFVLAPVKLAGRLVGRA